MLCDKWAILDPFSLMAKGTAVTTVFPGTGLLGFLLSPKNSDNEFRQKRFHTRTASGVKKKRAPVRWVQVGQHPKACILSSGSLIGL